MAEPHVMDALRGKRSELSGILSRLEQQIVQHRASLVHLDAAMRLFDPDLALEESGSRPQLPRSAWFHPGECLRLIHGVLREAPQPMTTRTLTEQVMSVKAMAPADERSCALVQKTVLGPLSRAKATIQQVEIAGVVSWRIGQAACARCQ
jgi:hypothetical protein